MTTCSWILRIMMLVMALEQGWCATAQFVGMDTTTKGDWESTYGSEGQIVVDSLDNLPAYATATPSYGGNLIWNNPSSDPRALSMGPGNPSGIASAWTGGSTVSIDLNLTDGNTHLISLYVVDFDGLGRSEQIQISDQGTATVLDTEDALNFTDGQYFSWNISGHVIITITNQSSYNAVISGIFIDPGPPLFTWTNGAGDQNWSTPGNWSPSGPPDAGATVAFASSGTNVNINGAYTVAAVLLNGTSDMTFTPTGGSPSLTITDCLIMSGSNNFNFNANVILGSDQIWVQRGTGILAMNANISDNSQGYSLTMNGPGTVVMSGTPSYTGATVINAGVIDITQYSGLNANASPITDVDIAAGATLEFDTGNGNSQAALVFSGTGTILKAGPGEQAFGGYAPMYWELSPGALIDVEGGTLTGGNNNQDVWSSNYASLHIAAGATFTGVEANVQVDALTGAGTFSGGYGESQYTGDIIGASNGSGTFSGSITDAGAPCVLIKQGTGTQWLTGTLQETGTLTVENGSLVIDGNGSAATGATTVESGATLSGSGSLGGNVTVQSGGTLMPGDTGPGTFTLTAGSTALTLNTGSTCSFALGTSSDLIACTGSSANVSLGGTLVVTTTGGLTSGTYTLMTFTGSGSSGAFSAITMPIGFSGSVSINNTTHLVQLMVIGPQVSVNSGITVAPGASVTVENSSLQATYPGESDSSLTYTLTTAPAHGALRTCSGGNPVAIAASGTFTQADIDNNLISYEHGDLSAASDSFQVTVTDPSSNTVGPISVAIAVSGTGLAYGLVAYWPMEQTSGSTLIDTVGASSAAITGTPNWTTGGRFQYALAFDGSTNYATAPPGLANFTTGLTISIWANASALTPFARMLEFTNGATQDNITLCRFGGNPDFLAYTYQGSTASNLDTTGGNFPSNSWQHLVCTVSAGGAANLYQNGTNVMSGTMLVPSDVTRADNYIGAGYGSPGSPAYLFQGSLTEARTYNRACSPGEVKLLSQQAAPLLSGVSSTQSFTQFAGAVPLSSSTAAITVADCLYFSGGSLQLSNSNATASGTDVLAVAATGGITMSSGTVSYAGNAFATVDGTANGLGGLNLLIHFTTTSATPTAIAALINALTFSTSGTPASLTTRALTLTVSDLAFSATATIAMSVVGVPVITARLTQDLNGDGHIDTILVSTDMVLNNDFSAITATVAGYLATGCVAGPSSTQFYIQFTPGSLPDTGATPVVQITANSSLAASSGGQMLPVDGSGVVATDGAAPVLMSSFWTDGGTVGVSTGNTVTLTFSEPVTTSGMVVSDLGLPVISDSLSTTTISNQSNTNTITMTLAGTPRLTPGGTYSSGSLSAGAPTGIYLAGNSHVQDQVGLVGVVGLAGTAVDLGPTTNLISIAWVSGSDPKSWALGAVSLGTIANTITSGLNLTIANVGNCNLNLTVTSAAGSPSNWLPGSSPGLNTYMMLADSSGASSGAPMDSASYSLSLTTSQQSLVSGLLSGAITPFALYVVLPTTISSNAGVPQTVAITITANLAP